MTPDGCADEERRPPRRRGSVLAEAAEVVNGKRQDEYGDPEDSFELISDLWTDWLRTHPGGCCDNFVSAHDVAMMMALMKVARIAGGRHDRDSYRDAVGYIALACDIAGARDREKE